MPNQQDYLAQLSQQVSQNPQESLVAPQESQEDPYAASASGDAPPARGGTGGGAQRPSDPFLTAQVALAQIPLRPARRPRRGLPAPYRPASASYTLSSMLGGYS